MSILRFYHWQFRRLSEGRSLRAVVFIVVALSLSSVGYAGDFVGNGGDMVVCDEPDRARAVHQPEAGYYSLDYLLVSNKDDIVRLATEEEYFDHIEGLLDT